MSCKKICLGLGGSCCLILAALGIFIGVVAIQYDAPTMKVDAAQITFPAGGERSFIVKVSANISITNPNGWPVSGDVENAIQHLNSTKAGGKPTPDTVFVNEKIPTVHIRAHSTTNFSLQFDSLVLHPGSSEFADRLLADCGGGAKQTYLQINITDARLKIAKVINRDLPSFSFDPVVVPCDMNTTHSGESVKESIKVAKETSMVEAFAPETMMV